MSEHPVHIGPDLLDLIPPVGSVTAATASVLQLVEADPIHDTDRRRIVAAIIGDAFENAGEVDPNRVRRRLTNEHGLTVNPRVVGAVYHRLIRQDVLKFDHWVPSQDVAGGNAGKPARAYRMSLPEVGAA